MDSAGMPVHLPMGVTADGRGPTEPRTPHHRICWCGHERCMWTVALAAERAEGRAAGRAGVERLAWVTQAICDCESMRGRFGAHRDECPVTVLRIALGYLAADAEEEAGESGEWT